MKTWHAGVLIAALLAAVFAFAVPQQKEDVPKYVAAQEKTFRGVVQEVKDRECPMSGGMGSHVIIKLDEPGKTIEVHIAPTRIMKDFEVTFNVGDKIEIIGTKVVFEGVETIFAREIHRGGDVYVFRDKNGKPIW